MARVYHMNDEVLEVRSTILAKCGTIRPKPRIALISLIYSRLGDVVEKQGGTDTRSLHTGPTFPPTHIIT